MMTKASFRERQLHLTIHYLQFHASPISFSDNAPSAYQLFDDTTQRGAPPWNDMLMGYTQRNQYQEALNLFSHMHRSDVSPDASCLSSVLKACAGLLRRIVGEKTHCYIVKTGHEFDVGVGTALVDMYMKSGSVDDAQRTFDQMPEKNAVTWTSLLAGYVHNELADIALLRFTQIHEEIVKPNAFTFSTALAARAALGAVQTGMNIHSLVMKLGMTMIVFVGNPLMNLYSKCGLVSSARQAFDGMIHRDSVSWNTMLTGYVKNEFLMESLEILHQMRVENVQLTRATFALLINSCVYQKELTFARQLHSWAVKEGFGSDTSLLTGLVVAYIKCEDVGSAWTLFCLMPEVRNVVSWTAMIGGYLQNGNVKEAVDGFESMRAESIQPNEFTFSTILTAAPILPPLQVHTQVVKMGYENSSTVATALLTAYVRLGSMNEAANIFDAMYGKDIVSWSAMLSGYGRTGDSEGGARLFRKMAREGFQPNEFTFSSVINSCSSPTATIEQGKQFHGFAIKSHFENGICVSSALLTMYARRGDINNAHKLFIRQTERDLVSWNSMISGYAQHGQGMKAIGIFRELQKEGLQLDEFTFMGVLTACTHAGLVEEGNRYFESMTRDYKIYPTMEHYACMVDVYGRAGQLENAMDLINEMPFPAGATVWRTVLGACRVHQNLELGALAANNLISLEPHDSAAYVLLSNMYAATGRWEERGKVRSLMEERKIKKEIGYSWIEVKSRIHMFTASDRLHPLKDQIYKKLDELSSRLKSEGYCPNTNFVLHDLEEEHKEQILSHHSERLAIVFGLISTPAETPLQIVKNLRVCGDRHTFIKIISRVVCREITVRDSNRFHHFNSGDCSCGDYW